MKVIARGLEGVCVAETRLSHVDGEGGRLLIGGFAVEDLAPNATFEEVLFLLWNGRLSSAAEHDELRADLARQRALPPEVLAVLGSAAERGLPAMVALRMGVGALSLENDSATAPRADHVAQAVFLVAKFPTIVAAYWRLRHHLSPVDPDPRLGHAANYLYMIDAVSPEAEASRALETYLNTVVDHGMNASTFTARVITSTRSDMVSALVGAIGALKGPLHGGAPGPALDMLFEVRERAAASGRTVAEEVEAWTRDTLANRGRVMGFGHRVYKVRDPRAAVLHLPAAGLFERAGNSAFFEDALSLERVVLRLLGELKPGRHLETNVELYTALILHAIGLDPDLFSPTFAVARAGGWSAHVLEQIEEDRLIRPQAAYVGERDRRWVSAEARA